jgi:hypothetical protein
MIMPQRAMNTLLVAAGCVAAIALLLIGANLVAAAQRGPRWRRRLLGAGLGVLAALGLVPAGSAKAELEADITCYDVVNITNLPPFVPITVPEVKQALDRLQQQMTLLQKYAAEAKLDKEVVEKVLATAEADLAMLEKDGKLEGLTEDADKRQAVKARIDARVVIDGLRLRLSPPASLAETPQWKRFVETWRRAEELAAKDGQISVSDKQLMLVLIESSKTEIGLLQKADYLSATEAEFLTAGIGGVGMSVYQKQAFGNPDAVTPMLMITCYKPMMPLSRSENSLRDLQMRLPILEQLATAEKLHPAAVERILTTCEADLKNLADLKDEKAKADAEKVRPAVQAVIAKIREKIKAAPTATPGK